MTDSFIDNDGIDRSIDRYLFCEPGADAITTLKVEKFNLQLMCAMYEKQMSNCNCQYNTKDSSDNFVNYPNKLNKYIDSHDVIIKENNLLKEEIKLLSEKFENVTNIESLISENKILKERNNQLTQIINSDNSLIGTVQMLSNYNDDLITANVTVKAENKNLKLKINKLLQRNLTDQMESRLSINNSMIQQLDRDFNTSLEISRSVPTNSCFECNALKVHMMVLRESTIKQAIYHEDLVKEISKKEEEMTELHNKLQNVTAEPNINQKREKKMNMLIQQSLSSVARKDQELKTLKKDTDAVVEFYLKEIGTLQSDSNKKDELDKEICTIINGFMDDIGRLLSQSNSNVNQLSLSPCKSLTQTNKLRNQMLTIVDYIKEIFDKLTNKNDLSTLSKKTNSMSTSLIDNVKFDKSITNDEDECNNKNILMTPILHKLTQVQELQKHLLDLSYRSLDEATNIDGRNNNSTEFYSPQYKITTNQVKQQQQQSKKERNIINNNANYTLNSTAYQSFIDNDTDHHLMGMNNWDILEMISKKIDELAIAIGQYSNIMSTVPPLDDNDDQLLIDRSCMAILTDEHCDLSTVESVKEFYETLVCEKQNAIDMLDIKLNDLKDDYSNKVEELTNKHKDLEVNVCEIRKKDQQMFDDMKLKYENNLNEIKCKYDELTCQCKLLEKNAIEVEERDQKYISNLTNKIENMEYEMNKAEYQITIYSDEIAQLQMNIDEMLDKIQLLCAQEIELVTKNEQLQSNYDIVNNKCIQQSQIMSDEKKDHEKKMEKVQKDNQDLLDSLKNMTNSLNLLMDTNNCLCSSISEVHNKISISPMDSCTNTNNDPLLMLRDIGRNIDHFHTSMQQLQYEHHHSTTSLTSSSSSSSSLKDDKNNTTDNSDVSIKKTTQENNATHFNDLTNISSLDSFRSDIITMDVTNFQIRSVKDIIAHPEMTFETIKILLETIETLKRRLRQRYEQNMKLQRNLESNRVNDKFLNIISQVDTIKEKCIDNNMDAEKVVQRISKKK